MLNYEFMRHAFAAAGIVAFLAGPVGYFMVLRGQSFAGHALAHVGFTGATGAMLIGLPPLWGLAALTLAAGIGMGLLGEKLAQRDVAIGMVLALSLGFGLLFLHFFTAFATSASALLFGNVLGVDLPTIWTLLALGLVSLAALALIARPLLFASIQPDVAEARGVNIRLLSVLFLAVVALTTAEAAQIVGVLLVFTLMVGPAAAAQNLTGQVNAGVFIATLLAWAEAWGGIAMAYVTDWPVSFWISLLSAAIYLVTLIPRSKWQTVQGRSAQPG